MMFLVSVAEFLCVVVCCIDSQFKDQKLTRFVTDRCWAKSVIVHKLFVDA